MTNIEATNIEMTEITDEQLETVNGGNPLAVALAIIAIYDVGSDFIEGFKEGYAAGK